jgi:hypothetical protein
MTPFSEAVFGRILMKKPEGTFLGKTFPPVGLSQRLGPLL